MSDLSAQSRSFDLPVAYWRDIPIAYADPSAVVRRIIDSHRTQSPPAAYHLCNTWSLALSLKDERLYASLKHPQSVNLADGSPVASFLARRLRRQRRQCRGPELFNTALWEFAEAGLRQALVGGVPDKMRSRLSRDAPPNVTYVDVGRIASDGVSLAEALKALPGQIDIVWVGLGTPKQDLFATQATEVARVNTIAVGAAFDFYSGAKTTPPHWLTGIRMEWAYRFMQEPSRLWRRYLIGAPLFLFHALRRGGV